MTHEEAIKQAKARALKQWPTTGKSMHLCPAPWCPEVVPNRLLACRKHWGQLSPETRVAIVETVGRTILDPERRAALSDARAEWAAVTVELPDDAS